MKGLLFTAFILISTVLHAEKHTLYIYHDSDYSNNKNSADAMFMGLNTALSEVNHNIQGFNIEVIQKNHRGNSIRSQLHMKQFLADPDALFILGGLHSPPYIRHREFINQSEILLLVPWAAGGPITRFDKGENWIYRLSIDDTKAGFTIMDFAANNLNCKNPDLLLEETGWGKSNFNTMNQAAIKHYGTEPDTNWYNWNIKGNTLRTLIRNVLSQNPDCILFVGNAVEGSKFFMAFDELIKDNNITVLSHWGITGGNFEDKIDHNIRKKLNLHVLQTCFNFNTDQLSEFSKTVFNKVKSLYPEEITTPKSLRAQTGFIHAYDLGRIIIKALSQIKLTGEIKADRKNLKQALENINTPVQGLIKTYDKPFSKWSTENPDAHEALEADDFCMAKYNEDSSLKLIKN